MQQPVGRKVFSPHKPRNSAKLRPDPDAAEGTPRIVPFALSVALNIEIKLGVVRFFNRRKMTDRRRPVGATDPRRERRGSVASE